MTDTEMRAAAKQFAEDWEGRGDEKQHTQSFWLSLLQKVLGVAEPEKMIAFEMPVKLDHTSFIDAYIGSTRVLIEQKSLGDDLGKGYKQSDGSTLTPFSQARRYGGNLPFNKTPRWIVTCNFHEFRIHDMNFPNAEPEIVLLSDLSKEYSRLQFLTDTGDENIRKEMEVSIQAGDLVGRLYDAFLKQYIDPTDAHALKSLNMLCVRLVFCLYAEDAGIFGGRSMFHDYMRAHGVKHARGALIDLFKALETEPEHRDPYWDADLLAFPYVNGGLFSEENITIPAFNQEIFDLLLTKASEDFNWSAISPTIFGAVFESTLNPETRRKGGMHYTSIQNIHKVIDPLFLDDLRRELGEIKAIAVLKTRVARLKAFQQKLSRLVFLDPACGSGNFLTQTYISLRRLENEALAAIYGNQIVLDVGDIIQVSIGQFYGIEINDFAVTVAKTALWIAESQMMKETEDVVHRNLDFLPLKSYANIVEGNALRLDWAKVAPTERLNYIMGNPPFIGASMMTAVQKGEIVSIIGKGRRVNSIDYVGAWYHKAAQLMQGTTVRAAFVSTNSITQGEQVAPLWEKLLNVYKVQIDFAYRTFKWYSEAKENAAVHCVIIGFSTASSTREKRIFSSESQCKSASNINPYLIDAPDVLIPSRGNAICDVPRMTKGNQPSDGGNLILSQAERDALISQDAGLAQCIRRYVGSRDFINNDEVRYCLWLKGVSPSIYRKNGEIMRRLNAVRTMRQASSAAPTRALADQPYLFFSTPQTDYNYLCIPEVSSERRRYVPIGFLDKSVIASNKLLIVPGAMIYHFGILTSNVHMAWMRAVCGRLKSDYQYSSATVYNTFPWPDATDAERAEIERTAQAILDARALYPACSLADLYDPRSMMPEVLNAHQQNDRAVMEAYGMPVKGTTESDCVAELMRRYQALAEQAMPVK